MNQINQSAADVQVFDLVLDPFVYRDTLATPASMGLLDSHAVHHLVEVLPLAIAQLDAVGEEYGAIALAGLQDKLAGYEVGV